MGWEAAMPVLLFALVAAGMAAAMIAAGMLFGPRRSGAVKSMPYESGMDPIHDTRKRFDVRFHLVAIAFLVFDVELLFLYPWAVATQPHPAPVAVAVAVTQTATTGEPVHTTVGIDAAVQEGRVSSRSVVFVGAMFFLALLTVGLVYDWRKGVFQWR